MIEKSKMFSGEVQEVFQFLELDYGYHYLEELVRDAKDWRETTTVSRYVGANVGIEISWYFAGSSIGVAFVELQQPYIFQEDRSFYPLTRPNVPKAISLYTLAEMLGKRNEADFLLKDTQNTRQRNKREKIIEKSLHEVIVGLARATKICAIDILKGDTSIFSAVMEYELAEQKRRNPNLFIPGLKQQDETTQ
jgi:hypothetical protein